MAKEHPYKKIVLPNKLTVLLYRTGAILSTHAVLYVRVGAVYETQKERGISHFTEHMPFLGTNKYTSPLTLSQIAQKLGAKYNGWTDRFSTRYWIGLPYTNIKDGVDFLYQLAFEPLIERDDVEKEKGVILSEFNDFWHNPDRRFNHESWKRRFKQKDHPYSYRPLGIPSTIKALKQEKILSWRNKYYNPANMILSIAGNIDKASVLELIQNTFGKKKAGAKRVEPKFNSKNYSNFSIYLQKEIRPQIRFIITFPAFGRKETTRQERMRLRLLNHIFGRGMASRIYQRLREKERFVYRIGSDINLHTWMGTFGIWGSVPVEKLLPAMNTLREEINFLAKGGVTEKEIDLSRSYMSASTLMKFDNPESIAHYFGYQVFDEEKVWFPEDYIREAKKIKKSDLDNLAKQIIDYSRVNISLLGDVPQKQLKAVEQIFKG